MFKDKAMHSTRMENGLAVLIVLTPWVILGFLYAWKHCSNTQTGEFCRQLCEQQIDNMNNTFNTAIAAYNTALHILHVSNNDNTMTAFPEQFCWKHCTSMDTMRLAELEEKCQDDMTKLHGEIQRLQQRQAALKKILQGRWLQTAGNASTIEVDSMFWSVHPGPMLIVVFAMMVTTVVSITLFHEVKGRLATIQTDKERLEVQVDALKEDNIALADEAQLLKGHFNEQQQQTEELLLDSENRCTELAAWNRQVQQQLNDRKERTALLASWNLKLYEEDSELHSKNEYLSKKYRKCQEKLTKKDKELQNAHKFWQEWQSEEKKARQLIEEKYNSLVSTVKSTEMTLELQELKQKRRLTVEILNCHDRIYKLELLQKPQVDNRETEKHLMLMKKMEDLENERRLLMQEIKKLKITLTIEREKHEIACRLERKRTIRELERNSSLEREIMALKEQTARLEKGLLMKASKSTKQAQLLSLSPRKNQGSQTMDDWRLNDFQNECESRFDSLQKTIDDLTKETDEVSLLKANQEELRIKLEDANRRCTTLEKLVHQPPCSQIVMCNLDGLKPQSDRWSQRGLSSLNLITGLQKVDTRLSFLTPPPIVSDLCFDRSVEKYLSIQ